MRTQFFRLPPRAQESFLIAVLLIVLIAILPNYEAAAYKKTPPSDDWVNDVGYPAGDGTKIIESLDEIAGERHVYTFEVDASMIQPLGVYRGVEGNSITKNGFLRAFQGYGNDPETTMGQYYSVELKHGKAIVFIDDAVVKIPKHGTVRLPRGKTELLGQVSREYISEKAGFSQAHLKYYVDMVGSWRRSTYAQKAVSGRILATAIIFLTVFPGGYILLTAVDKWLIKTGRAEEIAKRAAEQEEAKRAKAGYKPVVHKKRSPWYQIAEERAPDYKPTLHDKAEAHIDKVSAEFFPGYDWRSDKRRTWGKFGGTLAYLGFSMTAVFIFVYFASWKNPIPLYVVFIVCGISLCVGIAGVRIAIWDNPRPYMTKPDPDKGCSFTMNCGGQAGPVTDESQIDEAYRFLIQEKRSWQLTIDPPLGALCEWNCFYDENAGFITDITLKYDTVTSKWRKSGKKPSASETACLKKIFTKQKRVRL